MPTVTNDAVESYDLNELFRVYDPLLEKCVFKYIKDPDLAADIAQDARVKICNGIKNFKNKSALKTWMYCIVKNMALDFLKSQKSNKISYINELLRKHTDEWEKNSGERGITSIEYIAGTVEFENQVIEQIYQESINKTLYAALEQTPTLYREVFILKFIDELEYSEVAKRLNISEGTAKSRFFKGKKILKERFEQELKFRNLYNEAIECQTL